MKYRMDNIVIDAVQWTGRNLPEMTKFFGCGCKYDYKREEKELIIHTLEGDMTAVVNDYIIKGVQGEFYPCKPDIFVETYEKVEDD